MSNTYFLSNSDRAAMGRELLADFAARTRGLPGDRDLHQRTILVENARDAITYFFHALAEADIDIEDFTEACIEDYQTDLNDEAHERHQHGTKDESPPADRTEVRRLLPGATGPSHYPPSRTEWWWDTLGNTGLGDRWRVWPISVKRAIIAALVDTETKSMRAALHIAAVQDGLDAPYWEPEVALVAVVGDEADQWPPERLRNLFTAANDKALGAYRQIEIAAVVSELHRLEAQATRKGWTLNLAVVNEGNAGEDRTLPAAPAGYEPAWCQTNGRWNLHRGLTEADARVLTGLADAIAALPFEAC